MNILYRIIKNCKDGILLNKIFKKLKETNIILFYLVEEGLFDKALSEIEPKLSPLEFFTLDKSDIPEIAAKPERDFTQKDMLTMLLNGCGCLGVRYKNEIVSYMWYDLNKCSYQYLDLKLADNEAYLYGARTLKAYKGKALAPYLRQKVYEHLASIGRTKLYSITMYENVPSIMFKKKISAKNLKLYLRIKIFGRYKRLILLRTYK